MCVSLPNESIKEGGEGVAFICVLQFISFLIEISGIQTFNEIFAWES
jgi:hypothetical protein